jgi:ABC-type uncharacterized transport system auxiliary subunit
MMKMPRLILVLTGLLALSACSAKVVPEDNFYRLTLGTPQANPLAAQNLPAGLANGVIQVDRFTADGLLGGRAIVFSDGAQSNVAQTYHYDFWLEPPTILLQSALADTLRKAGVQKVVTPDLRIEPDYTVTGKIRAFEQVRGNPGFVRVQIELALSERAGGKLVMFKSYSAEPRTSGDGIREAVSRMSAAIDQIYSEFLKDLAAR